MNNGINYFPLNVHLDDKFELIEAEFGLKGFAIVVKLFQKIYGQQGYYCEWTEDVALLFGKNVGLGGDAVSEIVRAAIKRGIFDSELYDKYQILTSRGIQERYFEAVSRRKEVEVRKEYLLIKVDQIYKNVRILNENVNISSKNVNISEQKKVEESKVKEKRVEESRIDNSHRLTAPYEQIKDMYNSICTSYPQLRSMSDNRKKAIKARLRQYSIDDFKCLFEKAENSSFLKGANNRNWSATFDWLIKDSNMAKTLDGNYDDRPTQRNDYGERNNNPFFELINNGAFENGDDML